LTAPASSIVLHEVAVVPGTKTAIVELSQRRRVGARISLAVGDRTLQCAGVSPDDYVDR
jgi:hypothetical protein